MIGGEYTHLHPEPPACGLFHALVVASLPATAVNDHLINFLSTRETLDPNDIPWLVITIFVTACCSSEHSVVGGAQLMFNDELLLGWPTSAIFL